MASSPNVASYRLKVTLLQVKPPVWRRIVVPGQWRLGKVHTAIQVAMGWTDSHLHDFEVGGRRYAVPDDDWDDDVRPEARARLHEVAPDAGTKLRYTYDFGDGWLHDVVVESLGEPASRAACLAGRRACPPEDCSGPWGYAGMLEALSDPAHPEHETYVEWLGGPFDPEEFDLAAADEALRALR